MIVTWIAIQSQPIPWMDEKVNVAFVACGEQADEISLVATDDAKSDPSMARFLQSLETALDQAKGNDKPDLAWLRRAVPDQGTSIRLTQPRREQAESYRVGVSKLETELLAR
ncbi:hypothetical protein EON81_23670 [bacterium]|nr:MAG: hypothetical protein EON81_23670 [bacterium]